MPVDRWLPDLPDNLLLGTSSFSWDDWTGVFYPPGCKPAERLGHYATQFPTVEVDATFYAMPARSMVSGWAQKTPETFVIAMKVPKEITHEGQLDEVEAATAEFLDVTSILGPRRGPLLLQFPYVAKSRDAEEYEHGDRFYERLGDWLSTWSGMAQWAVEVRNSNWLKPRLYELLREHRVPLALTEYYTMPSLNALLRREIDPLTGDFAYVRFLGDRRRIDRMLDELQTEGKQKRFDELVWDREDILRRWVDGLLQVVSRMKTYVYFNNHFAGCGPASAQMFARLWREIHDLA